MSGKRAVTDRPAVRVAEDRRFRRAQVGPTARRRRAQVGWWLAVARVTCSVGLLGGGAFAATRAALEADSFHVTQIVIDGNDHLSSGEVLALLDDVHGRNLLTLDLDHWRGRVLSSPWVKDAVVRRVVPATIEVAITERQPLGIGRIAGRLYLLDSRGDVIDDYGPRYDALDLPIIDGLAPAQSPVPAAERAALAGRLLAALATRSDLLRRVSQINVADADDAVVLLDGDAALLHLGREKFVERLQSYLELAPTLRARIQELDYVDLRFDSRVFIRPQAGASLRPEPVAQVP
jgi:cell division septal protein FtsQ